MMEKKFEDLKNIVLDEYENGHIVTQNIEGLTAYNLKEFIEQPTDGILYDLNRDEMTVLSFIDKPKWINDFAVAKVVRALKNKIEELNDQVLDLFASNRKLSCEIDVLTEDVLNQIELKSQISDFKKQNEELEENNKHLVIKIDEIKTFIEEEHSINCALTDEIIKFINRDEIGVRDEIYSATRKN